MQELTAWMLPFIPLGEHPFCSLNNYGLSVENRAFGDILDIQSFIFNGAVRHESLGQTEVLSTLQVVFCLILPREYFYILSLGST